MSDYMKKPCKLCPFRRDVKPYLRPERGFELAYAASNPFNSFPCHETTVCDEEFGGDGSEMVAVESSKDCHGFLTLQIIENGDECAPDGFEPAYELIYSEPFEMAEAYAD